MKIIFENQEYEIKENTTIKEAFDAKLEEDIIAARYNNSIASLNHKINKNGKIEWISRKEKDGRIIYIRGLLYIMSKAFYELYPESRLTVNYQLSSAMFCEIENMEITQEIMERVKAKMQEIIKQDLPIRKVEMSPQEAQEFYAKSDSIRGRLQADIGKEKVSLYFCEDYYNYFYGTMPISTGFAKLFELSKFRNGFLVEYPSLIEPDKVVPKNCESLKIVSAMNEYDELYKLMKINTVYRLNKKIQEGNIKELILFSEAIHEKKIAEIANKIKQKQNIRMILIAGPTSSRKNDFCGKTRNGTSCPRHQTSNHFGG